MTTDRLLRINQVLELIPLSRTAWYNGIRSGLFPQPIRLGSRSVFWRLSDIERLIEANKLKKT
jgi:predicted DNA-binding transcriptional regulator AlpA